jgi:hypothetical protein
MKTPAHLRGTEQTGNPFALSPWNVGPIMAMPTESH